VRQRRALHHAWTLRYWLNDRQAETAFKDTRRPGTGRVNPGSGKKLAQDFQLKPTVEKRSGDVTFAEHSRSGSQNHLGCTPTDDGAGQHLGDAADAAEVNPLVR
jgi:hypothetical protein